MLFDDNIGFMTFDFYPKDIKTMKKDSPELVSPVEGFLRGNMFKDEYESYKNMTYYKVIPKTKREELLLEIMALSFAINDLNLYLDLFPKDEEKLKEFKSLVEKSCAKEMEFVKNYGPLELIDNDSLKEFKWIDDPWPWQNEGGAKYV